MVAKDIHYRQDNVASWFFRTRWSDASLDKPGAVASSIYDTSYSVLPMPWQQADDHTMIQSMHCDSP